MKVDGGGGEDNGTTGDGGERRRRDKRVGEERESIGVDGGGSELTSRVRVLRKWGIGIGIELLEETTVAIGARDVGIRRRS